MQLIQSLTPSEKRTFRVYVNRNNNAEDILFMQLFDYLDKQKEFDEDSILKKIPKIKKSQLSNIQANLYKQLLTHLRLIQRNSAPDITIRERLDFCKVLYTKGLYKASLDFLEKTKKLAIQHNYSDLLLSIINFERQIESQHITGSMSAKAQELAQESDVLTQKIQLNNKLANVSLLLYGLFLRYGYIKDKKDYDYVTRYFKTVLPEIDYKTLGIYDRLYLCQSYVWYYNMVQDFPNYYRYAQKWLDVFHENPDLINKELPLYLKGFHNTLNALFMSQKLDKFDVAYQKLLQIREANHIHFTQNDEGLWVLFKHLHGINRIYMTADYENGAKSLGELEKILAENTFNWDISRIMVLYYKVACVYFGNDDLSKAIFYLNKICDQYHPGLREDIQCFARILNLIAHFDLGNDDLVSYQIRSVYRFLAKMEDLQKVQQAIFRFLRKTPEINRKHLNNEFKHLKDVLEKARKDPYERRPFLYLDITSWLEGKIEGKPIREIIVRKMSDGKEN